MNFKPTTGVNTEGDIISAGKRGVILPSTKAATDQRQVYAALSPRLYGKKRYKGVITNEKQNN